VAPRPKGLYIADQGRPDAAAVYGGAHSSWSNYNNVLLQKILSVTVVALIMTSIRTIWFTADLHLGHGNIIKHCARPFLSADEAAMLVAKNDNNWRVSNKTVHRHDEALLEAINVRVKETDQLWILGDFCMGGLETARTYRDRICCRHVGLVWGNHDRRILERLFSQTMEQGLITVHGQGIWLNHYPMRSWRNSYHGTWHLYGHAHGRLVDEDNAQPWRLTMDVGVDAMGYEPISFDQIHSYMMPRVAAFEEYKAR